MVRIRTKIRVDQKELWFFSFLSLSRLLARSPLSLTHTHHILQGTEILNVKTILEALQEQFRFT